MEKSSNKILLTVLGIAVLVVATIGATFAYFSATGASQEKTVQTGKLIVESVTLGDISQQQIHPVDFDITKVGQTPLSTEVGKSTLEVDVTGTTVRGASYDIVLTASLSALGTGDGTAADVKWALYPANAASGDAIAKGDFSDATLADGKVIHNVDITPVDGDNKQNYDLYIYVADSGAPQNALQNVTATAKVTVNAQTPNYVDGE